MAGLGDLLGGGGALEQLFLWSVLSPIINEALAPFLTQVTTDVLARTPNVPLTPAQLAGLVVRGHLGEGEAAAEAAKAGIDSTRFHLMVEQFGNPPGPETLAEALRRGFIQEGAPGDEAPSYLGGIAQGDLQNKWADILTKLDVRLPGPTTAVEAAVRGMVADGESRRLFVLFGGDPEQYDLEYNVAGQGPSPVEAGVLANREFIPWDGIGPNVTSFAQAVNESRFKNKWTESYKQLAIYLPPPRTVKAMLHEGSIDEPTAIKYLKWYGVAPDAIPAYTGKANKGAVQTAHGITEANILTLYKERGITQDEARQHLIAIGYSDSDTAIILAAADLEYQARLSTATIAAIKAAYLHHHISRGDAITQMDAAHINATYRDSLLELWDLEILSGVKQLSAKQVLDMWSVKLLDRDQATLKLEQVGYSNEDAALLIALNDPNAPWLTLPPTNLSNPGG